MPLTLGRSSRRQAAGHPGETGDELRKPRTGTHGPQAKAAAPSPDRRNPAGLSGQKPGTTHGQKPEKHR